MLCLALIVGSSEFPSHLGKLKTVRNSSHYFLGFLAMSFLVYIFSLGDCKTVELIVFQVIYVCKKMTYLVEPVLSIHCEPFLQKFYSRLFLMYKKFLTATDLLE